MYFLHNEYLGFVQLILILAFASLPLLRSLRVYIIPFSSFRGRRDVISWLSDAKLFFVRLRIFRVRSVITFPFTQDHDSLGAYPQRFPHIQDGSRNDDRESRFAFSSHGHFLYYGYSGTQLLDHPGQDLSQKGQKE